jgi:predicted metalloprotease with PDZ domain
MLTLMHASLRWLLVAIVVVLLPLRDRGPAAAQAAADAPVEYRLAFPAPAHRWMQVEVTFAGVPSGPLQLRMSRSSPGRYALHEFAKNIYDVEITDPDGRMLSVARPAVNGWDVSGHQGTVRVRYKIFGDRVDGTYLGIDSTHAHINMPAALMWARGLEQRGAIVHFEPPAGAPWQVATQLFPGSDRFTYTAPNLQYLMDSPTEFSAFGVHTFRVSQPPDAPLFRVAVHHDGTDAELQSFAGDVQKIVSEARHVFGEYPAFDANTYTFIGDYVPWAHGDAMEHRNSTFLSNGSSIRANRAALLASASHEFFHVWNVERIRPLSLEPFNFEDVNMSGELWLAEGFTSYYESLVLIRAGLTGLGEFAGNAAGVINTITVRPGRGIHTLEEMSRMAPFVDAATSIDRTNLGNTFISYYTWGEGVGLGLDLTLRDRSDGRITLDHFMRALWRKFGKPGGRQPGYVDHPYTVGDARTTLAEVAGDTAFADDFFARFIQGHEVVDYARLLRRAGLVLRPRAPRDGFIGELAVADAAGGVRVVETVPFDSPAYAAGLERDDTIVSIGGSRLTGAGDLDRLIRGHKPGDAVPVVFERRGHQVTGTLRVVADPRTDIVPAEQAGETFTPMQRQFRTEWLGSQSGNTF